MHLTITLPLPPSLLPKDPPSVTESTSTTPLPHTCIYIIVSLTPYPLPSSKGSTLRDGIDIDDSSVISRLHHRQIVYFDRCVVVRTATPPCPYTMAMAIHPGNTLHPLIQQHHLVHTLWQYTPSIHYIL